MKANIGSIDRAVRMIAGLAFIGWALLFAGSLLWAWIGIFTLATALVKFCPAYEILGFRTCKTK